MFIAVAAALLGSLHAMDYDGAVLAPFAVSAAFSNRWFGLAYAAAIAIPPSVLTVLAPNEPAKRVVGAAAVAGLLALVVDIFVL